MKYKALVLSFLLLLPLLGTSAYFVRADWPIPSGETPILYVDMNNTGVHGYTQHWSSDLKVWGPCVVSTNFNVDVKLVNDNETTDVDVYAFDFNLNWLSNATSHINLVGITTHIPTGWFTVYASTLLQAWNASNYHLAATAMPPAEGLIHAINQSLVTLTFHIIEEPCWPNHFTTPFDLTVTGLSSDGGEVAEIEDYEVDDGSYDLGCNPPDIHLTSPDQFYDNTSATYYPEGRYFVNESAAGVVHTIKIWLSNITHAFGFYVYLKWDARYKTTDIQSVRIGPDWILANYQYENIEVGDDYLNITVIRSDVKPLICAKLTEAFEVDLTVIPTPDAYDYKKIPTPTNTTISITEAFILEDPHEEPPWFYEYTLKMDALFDLTDPIPPMGTPLVSPVWNWGNQIYYSCDMWNFWNPKRPDITLDGHVNIADLTILLKGYGKGSEYSQWFHLADLVGSTTVVDIYDFVYIAKNFGDC